MSDKFDRECEITAQENEMREIAAEFPAEFPSDIPPCITWAEILFRAFGKMEPHEPDQ